MDVVITAKALLFFDDLFHPDAKMTVYPYSQMYNLEACFTDGSEILIFDNDRRKTTCGTVPYKKLGAQPFEALVKDVQSAK